MPKQRKPVAFRFCPYDGTELSSQGDGQPSCRVCDFVAYDNPKPCVAVLVIHRNKLLLARRGIAPSKGMWDIPGGFIEGGESAEHAAIREILEETGLTIKLLAYLGSFSDSYGLRRVRTLNLGFVAEIVSGNAQAASDVADLRWFLARDLPKRLAFRHQDALIKTWLAPAR